jgi:16S rRNA (cytosine1402-N4)-methyltransferase
MSEHQPVLLAEVLDGLALIGGGSYVDCTYGRGGHCTGILARIGDRGRLLALDKDPDAVADGLGRFGGDPRFRIEHAGFEDFREIVEPWLGGRRLDGVLLDLGVSSPQLDTPERGFSFSSDGPLDMRMDTTCGRSAAEWLRHVDEADLARALARYGEEPRARAIAAAIVRERAAAPIETTARLAQIVARVARRRDRRTHPATRTFQALRIVVNEELTALTRALGQIVDLLSAGGRLAVISFHSLEDRIVKRFVAREARGNPAYAGLPVIPAGEGPRLVPVGRLIRASAREIERNPRARSARLRVAERVAEDHRT